MLRITPRLPQVYPKGAQQDRNKITARSRQGCGKVTVRAAEFMDTIKACLPGEQGGGMKRMGLLLIPRL